MNPADVANFFALMLALLVSGCVVAAAVPALRPQLRHAAPSLVAAVAVGATLGSLYFSERAGYVPCTLCWYQRIAMYPIAALAPLALLKVDRQAWRSFLTLGAIGLVISVYHVQLQLFPDQSSGACELTNPCTAKWVEAFGVVTIPQMAGASFALIVGLSIVMGREQRRLAASTRNE